ncbi:MAG: hypothetical protein GY842_00450 [bacterium]|nr:hypothetical protein [bacterium]
MPADRSLTVAALIRLGTSALDHHASGRGGLAFALVLFAALGAGCTPTVSSGSGGGGGSGVQVSDTEGAFGDFSFDLTEDDEVDTNGTEDPGADAQAGGVLFRSAEQGCAVCHGEDAEGTAALGGAVVETSEARLREMLAEGTEHQGGGRPSYSDDDFANLEAFLAGVEDDAGTNGVDTDSNGGL